MALAKLVREPAPPTRLTQRIKREVKGAPPVPPPIRAPRRENLCPECGKTIRPESTKCAGCTVNQPSSPNLTFPTLFQLTPKQSQASGNLITWNNVSPRLGLAFDVTGKGTSVIRFAYGRFYKMEGTELAEAVNPVGLSTKTFLWTDNNGDGIPQTSEWINNLQVAASGGGSGTTIDPNLKRPYSDEITASYERQIWHDVRISASYYYRVKKNLVGIANTSWQPSDFVATTTDNSGNPLTNPLNGQPLTLYNQIQNVGEFTNVVTNLTALDDNHYHGFELYARKQMSHHWQVLGGLAIQRQKGLYCCAGASDEALYDTFSDPNYLINRKNSYLNNDATYVFKVDSTYELPRAGKCGMSVDIAPLSSNHGETVRLCGDC